MVVPFFVNGISISSNIIPIVLFIPERDDIVSPISGIIDSII